MRIYAQTPARRTWQQLGDAVLLGWCAGWVLVGTLLHGLIGELAGPGRALEGAGRDFSGSMAEVGATVGDVPVAGGALQAPFDSARRAGDALAAAGQAQQDVVARIAWWLAVVITLIPVGWALLRWIPHRARWMREAAAAGRVLDDLDLLALRALSRRSLTRVAAVHPEPGAAWRAGDPGVIAALARLELAELGLRPRVRVTGAG